MDAAGYSPEIAAECGDPHYLSPGPLHACALILSVAQLGAPLVHPGFGFAAGPYRRVTSKSTRTIAAVTLREVLIGEAHHAGARLARASELADPDHFELSFRSPGGLLRGRRRLEEMKREFLASRRLWLDDAYIGEMASLAQQVRNLDELSDDFLASRHALGPFFSPAFAGSYVFEEKGVSRAAATTFVLCGEAGEPGDAGARRSARDRGVDLRALEAAVASELLERHGMARLDAAMLRAQPERLEGIQHWIGVTHLLSRDPERPAASLDAAEVLRRLRADPEAPPAYREIEEVRRRLAAGSGELAEASLSPLTRLRLLAPTSTRPAIRGFVRHMKAFVDPEHLEWWWRDAPDVFFGRLPQLSAARRDHFARWLDADTRA